MGFEDKRQNRQRPSMEFSDIGRNRRPANEPPPQTRRTAQKGYNDSDHVKFETRHMPPRSDSAFFEEDEYSERSRIIRLQEREAAEKTSSSRKRSSAKNRNRGAPPRKKAEPPSSRNRRQTSASKPRSKSQSKPQKQRKPKRKLNPKVKRFFMGVTAILAFVTVSLVVIFLVFKIDSVYVTGESPYTSEQIIGTTSLKKGDNLIFFSARAEKEKITNQLPYINTIEIKRKLPGTVEIAVTPLTVTISVQQENAWLYTTDSGKIAESNAAPAVNTMQVKGLALTEATAGGMLTFADSAQETTYKELLKLLTESNWLSSVQELNLSDMYNISLYYQGRIVINLGTSTDLAYKLQFTSNLIETEIGADEKGSLNVASVKENGRVIFSKDTEADSSQGDSAGGADADAEQPQEGG